MITKKITFKEIMQGTIKFLLMKTGKTLFGLNLFLLKKYSLLYS